jgi:hypothetical protein
MAKRFIAFVILSCSLILSCKNQDSSFEPPPTPSPQPSASAQQSASPVEAAGGFAQPEVGDTSADVFEGTAGIVEKKRSELDPATLTDVRTGRHKNFDRIVLEFSGSAVPGYHIEYVDKPARQCGSGDPVLVTGDASLLIQVMPANAHNDQGEATVADRERKLSLPVMKEAKLICDFEADVQWLVGVAKPNKYRVLELLNPSRLVVDIKH